MITKLIIRNFKKLKQIEFELGNPVVLIGPNNSGKTSVLQALTLWDVGLRKWSEQQKGKQRTNSKRPGVAINRRDLLSIPTPSSKLMWHHNKVREIVQHNGKPDTSNVNIEIVVEGITNEKKWVSAFEFDFANPESIYCRPLRKNKDGSERYGIDIESFLNRVAYLQPMSGLASKEDKLTPGSIDVRVGEGKTADVLRNICYQLLYPDLSINGDNTLLIEERWENLKRIISNKFGVSINKPVFISETGSIEMSYTENNFEYDLSSGGRGFQQTLLLLAYLYSYPDRIILLDEPDAHLEVIRQREIYNLITDVAKGLNSQLIIASHSEIVMNQAAESDTVVAFYDDTCHNLNTSQEVSQFRKMLTQIGWDKYYLAKSRGHILYLEGATDNKMLKEFAKLLNHPVLDLLEKANIEYTSNNLPSDAESNFYALQAIIKDLKGIALFDRLNKIINAEQKLKILQWKKRELENYFAFPEVLLTFAKNDGENNLFEPKVSIMEDCIHEYTLPVALKDRSHIWWADTKLSDDYLTPIFESYYKKQNLPNLFPKGRYYELIKFLKKEEINTEISEMLDLITLTLS
jgi:AAA15 family ATPase/GTPase